MTNLDLADGLRLLHGSHEEGHFGHHAHLCFGWAVLDETDDVEDAVNCVSLTIRHVAQLGGTPDKYHETVTIFWVKLLDYLRRTYPGASSVDERPKGAVNGQEGKLRDLTGGEKRLTGLSVAPTRNGDRDHVGDSEDDHADDDAGEVVA